VNVQEVFFKYWEQIEAHSDLVDLGMGMPSPALISSHLNDTSGFTNGLKYRADYQPHPGRRQVREVLARYETDRTGIAYSAENIMLVSGAIRGFSLVLDTLVHKESHLIETLPTYPLLAGYARHTANKIGCDLTTIRLKDTKNFDVTEGDLLPHITNHSVIYFANPSNPTGRYISHSVLDKIIQACEQSDSLLILDESCDVPLANDIHSTYKNSSPHLIRIVGLSKNLLLAGFRIAYLVAERHIVKELSERFSFSDANAPTIINDALIDLIQKKSIFDDASKFSAHTVYKALNFLRSTPNVQHVISPEACYYIFIKANYKEGSWKLFEYFLNYGVDTLPGVLFGLSEEEPWFRICCGRGDEELAKGLKRLRVALEEL